MHKPGQHFNNVKILPLILTVRKVRYYFNLRGMDNINDKYHILNVKSPSQEYISIGVLIVIYLLIPLSYIEFTKCSNLIETFKSRNEYLVHFSFKLSLKYT